MSSIHPFPKPDAQAIEADVLVVGGGPAGCWAAFTALETGARVVLAEKGFVGTSGATAAGNTTMIYVPEGGAARDAAVERRLKRGGGLVERRTVERVIEETARGLDRLADLGYRYPALDDGRSFRGSMRGPDYLHLLRQRLIKGGARILDHSPAQALLTSGAVVAGARGRSRLTGEAWTVRAGAVVIATGGCAFLSRALGTNNLTGDGYLMAAAAAAAGATLSGMEFTGQYGIAPAFSSVTKGILYFWATFMDAEGREIDTAGERQDVARTLLHGPVYAVVDKAPPHLQEGMRRGQPNMFVGFDRMGIDPFTQRFPITLRHEGTVRGTSGLATDAAGATDVPGLFAAGDAASREAMSGATSGGGGPNASWALATGIWSGRAAAAFSARLGARKHARPAAVAAGSAAPRRDAVPTAELIGAVQAEILPLDRSYFRTETTLQASRARLDALWGAAGDPGDDPGHDPGLHRREAVAMLATSRWIVASALARRETRGIQRRLDRPDRDDAMTDRIAVGGLDRVWTSFGADRREAAAL